jgi:hypothetical protein
MRVLDDLPGYPEYPERLLFPAAATWRYIYTYYSLYY